MLDVWPKRSYSNVFVTFKQCSNQEEIKLKESPIGNVLLNIGF